MTQCDRILARLKAAGSKGVRSDEFIADYMPRAAARIKDLKDRGYQITSEREGNFTRYTLVGSSAGNNADAVHRECHRGAPLTEEDAGQLSDKRGPGRGIASSRRRPSSPDAGDRAGWGFDPKGDAFVEAPRTSRSYSRPQETLEKPDAEQDDERNRRHGK